MADFTSPKKGSNIICRVSNATPEMVCSYVRRLPKSKMTEEAFRERMGKKWFSNEHQAPEQWGLYYIDGKYYYPRFNRDITIDEAEQYLFGWMKRLIVINPYTSFRKTSNDSRLVESIVKQLETNPDEHDLKTIIARIINSEEPFVINEIIANALNNYSEVLSVKTINKDEEKFEVSLLPYYQEILKTKYNMTKKEYFDLFNDIKLTNHQDELRQQIFYGAPGTGKSHEIKKLTTGESVIRTTFHPDSDYSTFVGCYKPTMDEVDTQVVPVVVKSGISLQDPGTYKEKRITYKFVMQAFLKAYLGAWKKWADAGDDGVAPQFLVIEEINRGNCAQIFGDLFQLLDRSDNNFSEYPIEADTDLQQEIERAFMEHKDYKLTKAINAEGAVKDYISNYDSTLSEDIQSGRILLLPPNLYIWATMNTSDQSLFPIDSAFKRRWEWKYMKIKKGKDEYGNELNWRIVVKDNEGNTVKINDEESLSWWDFISKINEIIASITSSADKQLGYFFCKADSNGVINAETFVSKVVFYLWNDVFKDYGFEDAVLFQYKEMIEGKEVTKDLTFPDFYNEEGEKVNEVRLKGFLESVMNWKKTNEEHN